jgi:adenine-specific DNA-methyltransferase
MIFARHHNNETDIMDQPNRKDIEQYKHKDKSRLNNPQVGMVSGANDPDGNKKRYSYDPHLDPTLEWTGKKEQTELDVDTVSIHVHERIDPKSIIQQVHKNSINSYAHGYQHSLFEQPFDHRPVRDEVSFYQHKNAWANRLIAGDSLLVMNSLLEKEGMAEQVQMVYMDPPYGISYGSNFQPFVDQRDVTDGKDADLNTEPEMLKAFRDTWELGIHSYLSYLRDRVMLSHQMLSESGSFFMQISEDNLHIVRMVLDEIFGKNNFVSQIFFKTTGGFATDKISRVGDYLLWYAKDAKKIKYRQLFEDYQPQIGEVGYNWILFPDGTSRGLTAAEKKDHSLIPKDGKIYKATSIKSQGGSNTPQDFEYLDKVYSPGPNHHWKTSIAGLQNLGKANRIHVAANSIQYRRFQDDFPHKQISNMWMDTGTGSFGDEKKYVVETSSKVVERCILMTTDPGDLVIDPTCGSGVTAYAAEKWGRRWITMDTSRISIHLAKQRLATSAFEWYKLAHENEGIAAGFVYKQARHVMLKDIAKNEHSNSEVLYDKPEIDGSIVRVSGPFTVEAIPAVTVKPLSEIGEPVTADNSVARSGETIRQDDWRSELLKTGVRTKGGDKIEFARVELIQGTRYLHAEAETIDGKRVLVSFGPEAAPLEQKQVEMALEEAGQSKPAPQLVLFAAFQFDPEASKDIDETNWAGVELLKVQMNTDLLTSDLKKSQSSSESFWLVGQPDVQVTKNGNQYSVTVDGFDYYNPKTGEVQSGGKNEIAMWMLDTDYDGRSIFPTQMFFPMAGAKDGWNKLAKNLKAELDEDLLDMFEGTESIAFDAGDYKRCAIKIIDNRGIESLTIKNLE